MKTSSGMDLDTRNVTNHAHPPADATSHCAPCSASSCYSRPCLSQPRTQKIPARKQSSSDNDSIGFNLGKNASAKDVGLPIYPGARRHIDDANDSSALNMGFWGGSTGFKLFVLKMESADAPEKVAAFYRKALAKYGTVLDCTNGSPSTSSRR